MSEHVRIEFEGDEAVYIDGQPSGRTNETLRVEAGTHGFALGDAASSACPPPREIPIDPGCSTIVKPFVVTFPAA